MGKKAGLNLAIRRPQAIDLECCAQPPGEPFGPPLRLPASGPWQSRQRSARIGRTDLLKSMPLPTLRSVGAWLASGPRARRPVVSETRSRSGGFKLPRIVATFPGETPALSEQDL